MEKKCLVCPNPIKGKPSKIKRSKYCSHSCYSKAIIGVKKPGSSMKKEKHPNWKLKSEGKMEALHQWVRRRFPKPDLCMNCRKEPPYDLANISQEYKSEVSDWEWLCRRCHITGDGRISKLIQSHRGKPSWNKGIKKDRDKNLELIIKNWHDYGFSLRKIGRLIGESQNFVKVYIDL